MSSFDYGNARLRAMKSRLLPRDTLDNLTTVGNVPALLNALTKTGYRSAVEKALVQFTDMTALQTALRQDLVDTVSRVRQFFTGQAAVYTTWVMRRYDVDNLKTVLRGVMLPLPAHEIVNATLPIGHLTTAELTTLAHSDNITAVIDLLATWRDPLAQPLLAVRAKVARSALRVLEVALEQWYFQEATALVGDGKALRQMTRFQADVTNILTVLRLVHSGEAEAFLAEAMRAETAVPLFIGPGHISQTMLLAAAQQPAIAKAVAMLSCAPYRESLSVGLAHYETSQRLSAFERQLQRAQRQQAASFFIHDPHGIGILLGYLVLKTAEISHLRHIAHSLQLGEPPEVIRLELM